MITILFNLFMIFLRAFSVIYTMRMIITFKAIVKENYQPKVAKDCEIFVWSFWIASIFSWFYWS